VSNCGVFCAAYEKYASAKPFVVLDLAEKFTFLDGKRFFVSFYKKDGHYLES
jgi:hypothetical protein